MRVGGRFWTYFDRAGPRASVKAHAPRWFSARWGSPFGVLLLAFAGNATFTLLSVRRARQGVVANEAYLELQGSVDAAWKSLNDFAPSLGRGGARLDPNLPLALRTARKDVDDALGTIDRYIEKEPTSFRRAEFEGWRRQIATLGRQLDVLAGQLGAAAEAIDPKARAEFESHFATLIHGLNRTRRPRCGASAGRSRSGSPTTAKNALSMAIALGAAVGLAAALAVFVFIAAHACVRWGSCASGRARWRAASTRRGPEGHLARRDRRSGARVRRHGRRHPGSASGASSGRSGWRRWGGWRPRSPTKCATRCRRSASTPSCWATSSGRGPRRPGRPIASIIDGEVDRLAEITETYLRFARLPRPKLESEDLGVIVRSVIDFSRGELAQDGSRGLRSTSRPTCRSCRPTRRSSDRRSSTWCATRGEATRPTRPSNGSRSACGPTPRRGASRCGQWRTPALGSAGGDLGRSLRSVPFSDQERGTGLGLALVQQIVVDHGGQIEVESGGRRGTTFTLGFLRRRPQWPAADPVRRAPGRGSRGDRKGRPRSGCSPAGSAGWKVRARSKAAAAPSAILPVAARCAASAPACRSAKAARIDEDRGDGGELEHARRPAGSALR